MNVLGINFIYHDSSACVVRDGKLEVALEEERLTRKKHTNVFPELAIARCLEIAGLAAGEIDHIAISYQPGLDRFRKLTYGLGLGRRIMPIIQHDVLQARGRRNMLNAWLRATYGTGPTPEVHFVPHHLAHAVGSFFVSPYESAALLSIDGWGEWATTFKGVGRGTTFECFGQDYFPYVAGRGVRSGHRVLRVLGQLR